MKKQRTNLGRAAVNFLEMQHGNLFFDSERRVRVTLRAEFVIVERLETTAARREIARADDRADDGIFEDEEEVFSGGFFAPDRK